MTSYSITALEKLVKDGIETVEFLQQNPEDFQKTYGRSAIQKPSTRARIEAWESINPNNDNTDNAYQGSKGIEKRTNEGTSSGADSNNGRSGASSEAYRVLTAPGAENGDQQIWHDENRDGSSGRPGNAASDRLPPVGERRSSDSEGDQEPQGYNPDGEVDAGEYRQIMMVDHEMSSTETNPNKKPTVPVRNATPEDFENVFDEGAPKVHRRLRGIASMETTTPAKPEKAGPVKKGTDENFASTRLGDVQLSGSGAIPNVHPSLLHQPSTDADAENAQSSVQDVSTTGSIVQSEQAPQSGQDIERKVDVLLNSVESLAKKLELLPEVKEEIRNINKKITNLSLGLSTIESYIKSMMIIIPGSGKDTKAEPGEVNPDLKAVIGRDRTRGLKEVSTPKSNLESLDGATGYDVELDESHLIKDLDFSQPNAANFIPQNDNASYQTIVAMIRSEIKEKKKQRQLLKWVDSAIKEYPMADVYTNIREVLDEIQQ
ncbi:phosphoprotein [Rodent paramyxovirus]|uniref:Phosphoprotein n=1 Tax=Rodent paramyxovirus TaxID=1497434 RepID=A0AAD0EXC1_9MONO|nr:phosphoprotein [Rodent paramyxovirus]ATP66847.1 phosphoprotein [Rodent paramyxovirus]